MRKTRASIFGTDDETMDLSGFKPKEGPDPEALPPETVRAIAEASNFPSREAKRSQIIDTTPPAPAAKRPARRLRTGRTAQLNARATAQTVEEFYAIADRQGWKAAETLERAIAALRRELEGQGRSS